MRGKEKGRITTVTKIPNLVAKNMKKPLTKDGGEKKLGQIRKKDYEFRGCYFGMAAVEEGKWQQQMNGGQESGGELGARGADSVGRKLTCGISQAECGERSLRSGTGGIFK